MESPQNVGDVTTNSISNQLSETHLHRALGTLPKANALCSTSVSSAVYSGQKFIQIDVVLNGKDPKLSVLVLRRVQDSYVNVSQMLHTLILLKHFKQEQVDSFLNNEVFTNSQYLPQGSDQLTLFNDFRTHDVAQVRGLWIPYDKAISIALKFDIYEIVKKLLLVDVHDFDKLPKAEPDAQKRAIDDKDAVETSPSKKRKLSVASASLAIVKDAASNNYNFPYCLPPLGFEEKDLELVSEVKLKFSEIFKNDGKQSSAFTQKDVKDHFKSIFDKCDSKKPLTSILDVPLDLLGKTALHYASTLASLNLVASLIQLKISSPIRGDNQGESALISTIQVTNSMEKGNFVDMLEEWLWPNLWLLDNKQQSFLHYLILLATKNYKSSKFYFGKILEWMISNPGKDKSLYNMCYKIVNAQESESGNTALHLAGEHELKWFIYILLELNADVNISNNMGIKPTDLESVKELIELRKAYSSHQDSPSATKALLEKLDANNENDEYTLQLVHTGVEFLSKMAEFSEINEMEDVSEPTKDKETTPGSEAESALLSNKIFKSIQDLLSNTNEEYEKVIQSKKAEINNLNKQLRDATIITANNRFTSKKISEKISLVDTMKLQMTNITDKLQMLKKEIPSNAEEGAIFSEELENSTLVKFDADEPFIIKPLYEKLANNEKVDPATENLDLLPSTDILRARLKAYHEVNTELQSELDNLLDYSALTAKFKKVVSFCTGVDINEVDELLDGLLEAVEGQQ